MDTPGRHAIFEGKGEGVDLGEYGGVEGEWKEWRKPELL